MTDSPDPESPAYRAGQGASSAEIADSVLAVTYRDQPIESRTHAVSHTCFPDHPRHGRNAPLDDAFERLVLADSVLGSLASRHWLQRDLRITFVATLGPPLLWLVTGQALVAAVVTIGFGTLLAVSLWTVATQPLADSRRLLSAIRWIAVLLTLVGTLVAWSSPAGAGSSTDRVGPPAATTPANGSTHRLAPGGTSTPAP